MRGTRPAAVAHGLATRTDATQKRGKKNGNNLRDLSCLLRCSLRLNARLQNWHLYFFSGTPAIFFAGGGAAGEEAGVLAVAAAGAELDAAAGIVEGMQKR